MRQIKRYMIINIGGKIERRISIQLGIISALNRQCNGDKWGIFNFYTSFFDWGLKPKYTLESRFNTVENSFTKALR